MPGTFESIFVLAFDVDASDQPIAAFGPRRSESETAGIDEARQLAITHAGAVVWKRVSDPVVGEEGEPVVVFQAGRVGDFD
jgi:hypothetical protein